MNNDMTIPEDSMTILELLDNMKHKHKRATTRRKMGDDADSSMLGYTFNRNSLKQGQEKFVLTNQTKDNFFLFEKLKEIIKIVKPNFIYNGITINKNCEAKPHKDSNNIGTSIIVGVGNYEGGNLCIEGDEGEIYNLSLKFNFIEFDGKNTHYNTPITKGTKYTIIWFNNCICNKNGVFLN